MCCLWTIKNILKTELLWKIIVSSSLPSRMSIHEKQYKDFFYKVHRYCHYRKLYTRILWCRSADFAILLDNTKPKIEDHDARRKLRPSRSKRRMMTSNSSRVSNLWEWNLASVSQTNCKRHWWWQQKCHPFLHVIRCTFSTIWKVEVCKMYLTILDVVGSQR